jgi:cysteine-rich repeat protein
MTFLRNKSSQILIAFLLCLVAIFAFPQILQTAAPAGNSFGLEYGTTSGLGTSDIRLTVARIINVALSLLGIVALVIILYGGFVYMTAAGSEEKVAQAKKIITNGVIGMAIILSAFAITRFIFSRLGDATGFQGGVSANCNDIEFANNNRALCGGGGGGGLGGGGGGGCTGNTGADFVVRSITPSAPGTTVDMNNLAVRVIFSQPLAAAVTAGNVFAINRGATDVSGEFNYSFIGTNRSVIEARLVGNTATVPTGLYEVNVGNVQSATGQSITTQTQCGSFARDASFRVSTTGVVDTTAPVVGGITYNGLTFGGAIALPRNRTHLVAVPISDDFGVGYVQLEVILPGGNSLTIYDGPATNRGSGATVADPYIFQYPLFLSAVAPLNQTYTLRITTFDIDHNSTVLESQFTVVEQGCTFGSGAGAGEGCRQNGSCTQDSDCLSGSCDTTAGQCREIPLISDVSAWDGAGGNWITVLGNFFGETDGQVAFGVNINDGDDTNDVWVPAALAQCGTEDVWTNQWIIAEVPRDDGALPDGGNYAIRVTRAGGVDTLMDTTVNNRGPIAGPRQGFFRKDNTLVRPGLCRVVVTEGVGAGVATAGVAGTAVRAFGQGFTATPGQISFGGIQAPSTNWADTQIDSAVPLSLQPASVAVVVRVNGQDSNGVPFTIISEADNVRPIIQSVAPTQTTRGSFFTVTGQRFGLSTGIVYLAPQGITDCTPTTCTVATLPAVCGSTTWQDTEVVAAVPTDNTFPVGFYRVVVQDGSGRQTVPSTDTLEVIAGDPRPGICSLLPGTGPAPLPANHAGLTITGVNFSANPEIDPMTVRFFTRGAQTIDLDPNLNTWLQTQSTDITNVTAGEVFRTRIPVSVNGYSAQSGSVYVQRPSGLSNPVRYNVLDCNEPGAEIPPNLQCCVEQGIGVLRPNGFACVGDVRDAAYLWRFTTGFIPNIPRVVVSCDQANWNDRGRTNIPFPSPTPSNEWQQGTNTCVNSSIAIRFSMEMNLPATPNNTVDGTTRFVRLFTCADGQNNTPDCSRNQRTDVTDQVNLQYINQVLRIRQVPPAADLLPNTWYHVEVLNTLESVERNQPLVRTRPCADDTAFCFDFRTGDSQTRCELSNAGITPTIHTTDQLGPVLSPAYPVGSNEPLYYFLFGRGDQVCSVLPVDGLGWVWSVANADRSISVAPTPPVPDYTDTRATAQALSDNAPAGAIIQATNNTNQTNSQITAQSTLFVDLGTPRVKQFFPNCTEACVNASVGVEFNRQMDPDTYPGGLVIFPCASEAACSAALVNRANPIPITINADSDRLNLRVTPVAGSLPADTWYWAEARDTIISVGQVDANNNIITTSPGPALEAFGWRFRVRTDGAFCVADQVQVRPDPFKAILIGQRTKYSVSARTSPDQCNSNGQELNPWGFGYEWTTVPPATPQTAVATVSTLSTLGTSRPACTSTCIPAGSDIASGGTQLLLCGNNQIDPGEDCDISVAGTFTEDPGVSCGFNCLRPGSEAPNCGDGVVNQQQGEECDTADADTQAGCSANCTWAGTGGTFDASDATVGFCGSGEVTLGEECEDGVGGETNNSCSNQCLHTGTRLTQDWCDRNNNGANPLVTTACRTAISVCGNGLVESGEECEFATGPDRFLIFDPTNITTPIVANLPSTSCTNKCQLQNVCDGQGITQVPNSTLTCNRAAEGCAGDCTLAGSSVLRYSASSLCGDGQNADGSAGIGEFAWCELPRAGAVLLQNPVQVVTAVGLGAANPITGNQETQIQASITQVRGEATPLATAAQVRGVGQYGLQCGYTEYTEARTVGANLRFNDCPNAINGVATNSCCYARPLRSASLPADGQGLPNSTGALAAGVCRNTAINLIFDGQLDEETVRNKIVLARGYATAPGTAAVVLPITDYTVAGNVGIVAGQVASAYRLDSVGDEIVGTNNAALNPNNITVMTWIQLPANPTRPMNEAPFIVAKKPTNPTTGLIDSPYTLSINNFGTFQGNPVFSWGVANVGVSAFNTRVNDVLGQWVHLTGTFDGTRSRLYINGLLDRELTNLTTTIADSTGGVAIGNFLGTGSRFTNGFDGLIDETMIYNRALTDAEILAIFTAGQAGVCKTGAVVANCVPQPAGMVGWWTGDTLDNRYMVGLNQFGGPTVVDGRVGRAISFDGTDDRLQSPPDPNTPNARVPEYNFGSGDYTAHGWIRTGQAVGRQTIVSQGTSSNRWGVVLVDGRLAGALCQDRSTPPLNTGSAPCVAFQSPTSIADNQWHHFAISYDRDGQMIGYVDGNAIANLDLEGRNNNENNGVTDSNQYGLNIGAIPTILAPGQVTFSDFFDGQMDEVQIDRRVLTPTEITVLARGPEGVAGVQGNCGAGRVDVTNLVGRTMAMTDTANIESSDRPGLWNRIWQRIRGWFAGLFGNSVYASRFTDNTVRIWCTDQAELTPTLTYADVTVGGAEITQTTVRLKIESILEADTTYAVLIKGGTDGIKDTRGVGIASPDPNVNSRDDSIIFRTQAGDGICRLKSLSITPKEFLYTTPTFGNRFAVEGISTNGQSIVPIQGVYNWTWGWGPIGDPIFTIPRVTDPTVEITSTALEGKRVAVATATVTEDVGGPVGDVFSSSAQLRSLFCENPWPARAQYPFEDGVPFGGTINNDGVDVQGAFNGTSLPAANLAPRVTQPLVIDNVNGAVLANDVIRNGAQVYTDRGGPYATIPDTLVGARYLTTRNNNNQSIGINLINFRVNQPVTIYIAHDNRITTKPAWLRSFRDTGVTMTIPGLGAGTEPNGIYTLFRRTFPEGTVNLGGNFGLVPATNMYIPFIFGNGPNIIDGVNPAFFNFQMSYCADKDKVNDITDDLPYLRTFVFGNLVQPGNCQGTTIQCFNNAQCPGNGVCNNVQATSNDLSRENTFKRYLFFNDKNDDVIGIQVFGNPGREGIIEWYESQFGSVAGFQRLKVGGYNALSNGSNVYINALNQSGTNFFNNVYQFSINPDAQENTRDVFGRLINSLSFNINISDVGLCLATAVPVNTLPSDTGALATTNIACKTDFDCLQASGEPTATTNGVCSASKTKFLRDWVRLGTVRNAQQTLLDANAPALRSGTYIPGRSISLWPSWGTLGVGKDPINQWSQCGVCGELVAGAVVACTQNSECVGANNTCNLVEPQTCWDQANSRFVCPRAQSVLAYEKTTTASDGFLVHSPLEYLRENSNVVGEFINRSQFTTDPICQPNAVQSPFSQSCGDGVVNPATEQCDPPGATAVLNAVVDANGVRTICPAQQFATATCNATCQWTVSACQTGGRCGNGRVEPGEQCDDGARNGTYGSCNTACTGAFAQFCGNNTLDTPLEQCEISGAQGTGSRGFCTPDRLGMVVQTTPTAENLNDVQFVNANIGWAVGQNGGFLQSLDSGRTWVARTLPAAPETPLLVDVFFMNENVGWLLDAQNELVWRTTNGGQNWLAGPRLPESNGNINFNNLHFISNTTGWVSRFPRIIHQTTDGGVTWTQITRTSPDLRRIFFVSETEGWGAGVATVTAGDSTNDTGVIFRTQNGGRDWSRFYQAVESTVLDSTLNDIFFLDRRNGWAVGSQGTIATTNDGGLNWSRLRSPTTRDLNRIFFTSPTDGWIMTNGRAVFGTTDGGTNWRELQTNAPGGASRFRGLFALEDVVWTVGDRGTATRLDVRSCNSDAQCGAEDTCLALDSPDYHLVRGESCALDCQQEGSYCGDGTVQGQFEQCDDGNRNNNDTCSNVCQTQVRRVNQTQNIAGACGNNEIDSGEVCDNGSLNGVRCTPPYSRSCSYCSRDCGEVLTVETANFCGNGIIEGGSSEVCEMWVQRNLVVNNTDNELQNIFVATSTAGRGYIAAVNGTIAQCAHYLGRRNLSASGATTQTRHGSQLLHHAQGTFTCSNSCRSLSNTCTLCGPKPLNQGGASPRLAVINPMTGPSIDTNWGARTFVGFFNRRLPGTSGGQGLLAINTISTLQGDNRPWHGFRALGGNYNNMTPVHNYLDLLAVPVENSVSASLGGIESRAICNGGYQIFFDNKQYPYGRFRPALTGNPPRFNGNPANWLEGFRNPGDFFDFPVNGQGANVDNEFIVSPAVPEGTIRVVVRWTATESDNGANSFVGNLFRTADDRVLYTEQVASPTATPPVAENRCNAVRLAANGYWEPTGCTARGGTPGIGAAIAHGIGGLTNTFVQAFTIDTNNLVQGEPYAFFVSPINSGQPVPIANFDDTNITVEVFEAIDADQDGDVDATDQVGGSVFRPTRTFRIDAAPSSNNPLARFWHVFNVRRTSSYQISNVQQIQTGWQDVIRDLSIAGGVVVTAAAPPRACVVADFDCPAWPTCPSCGDETCSQTRECPLTNSECRDPSAARNLLTTTNTCTPTCRATNLGGCTTEATCTAVNGIFNRGTCVPASSVGSGGACDRPAACTNGTNCSNNRCLPPCTESDFGSCTDYSRCEGTPPRQTRTCTQTNNDCEDTGPGRASAQGQSCTPLPDFRVTTITGPTSANQGDTLEYTARICNEGTVAASGNVQVRARLARPNLPSIDLFPTFNSNLAVNQCLFTGTARFENAPAGQSTITFTADSATQIDEEVETNNDRSITVSTVGLPDLVVQSVSGPATAVGGGSATFTARVCNNGSADIAIPFSVRIRSNVNSSIQGLATVNSLSSEPGNNCVTTPEIVVNNLPTAAQTLRMTALVDAGGAVTEATELNNTRPVNLTITAAPDLVFGPATGPAQATVGQQLSYDIQICNTGGTAITRSFVVSASMNGVGNDTETINGLGNTSPGNCVIRTFNIGTLANPGTFTLNYEADSGSAITELSETNNSGSRGLTVRQQPDLAAGMRSARPTSVNTGSSNSYQFSFEALNSTIAGANQGLVEYTFFNGTTVIGTQTARFEYTTLNTANSPQTPSANTGIVPIGTSMRIRATIDARNQVAEANETNNVFELTIPILTPDFVLDSIIAEPAVIPVRQRFAVRARVCARPGSGPTNAFLNVNFRITGPGGVNRSANAGATPTPQPGACVNTREVLVTNQTQEGTYNIRAEADPRSRILESDTSNNILSRSFETSNLPNLRPTGVAYSRSDTGNPRRMFVAWVVQSATVNNPQFEATFNYSNRGPIGPLDASYTNGNIIGGTTIPTTPIPIDGLISVTVVADPRGQVDEWDETDNTRTFPAPPTN